MFTIKDLSLNEVNVIIGGLGELPAKVSTQLILKISDQIKQQQPESGSNESEPQVEAPNFTQ